MSRPELRTARDVALDVLVRVDDGAYSNLVLPATLARTQLADRDRAFATDLVYGTLRAQGTSDGLIARHCDRPLDRLDPVVRAALRMGTYQLINGTARHAAVSATVDACGARLPRARGLVNAVLRRVADSAPEDLPTGDNDAAIAVRTAMPEWIVRAARTRFGDDAESCLAAMNVPPAVTLRIDTGAIDDIAAELRATGAEVERGQIAPSALCVRGGGEPGVMAAVRDGRATPQDEGSQAVVAVVDAQPGERVLDIAAAPGGKTTGLARQVGATGMVVASDVAPGRAPRIAEAIARTGATQCHVVVADGCALPLAGTFDRVLLDAPCSGLGVLRRRAEARWRIQPDDVVELAELQRRLLAAAAQAVRPGGILIYAVCTFTLEETDAIVEWAGERLPELTLLAPPEAPWRVTPAGGALLVPVDSDGMFVARFMRTNQAPAGK